MESTVYVCVFHAHSSLCVCVCVSDCPQVQCVEQYIAQQADELALEPTDIINVTRKTEGKNGFKCGSCPKSGI